MHRKTKAILSILALLGFALSSAALRAQPVPVQQFDENQQKRQTQDSLRMMQTNLITAPELYPGENADVGPQRILRLKPSPTYFEVLADSQYAYTDNNRLAHQNGTSTAYTVNTLQLSLAPEAFQCGPGYIAPSVGFRSQWYNYEMDGSGGLERSLDFDAQTAFGLVRYQLHQRWEFDAELDYTRLLSQQNYHEFYSEITPTLSISRLIPLRSDLLLALGWQGAYHFSSVQAFPGSPGNVNDRLDNTLSATLTWQVVGNLIVQSYYHFEETHYPRTAFGDDRNDYIQTVGGAASYYFTRQLAARIYISGNFRKSDDPNTTSYSKFDTGLGASLFLRF